MPPQEKPGYLHLTRSQNPRRFERWCAIAHQRQPTRRASRRLPLSRSRVPPRGGRLAAVVVAIAATAALTAPVVVAATPAAVVPRRAPAAVVVTPPAPAVVITPAAAAAAVALVVARALAVALTERRHVATPAHLDLDRVLHLTQPLLARLLLAEDVEALLVAVDRFVVEEHEGAEAGLELAERGAARAEHEPDGRLRHVDRGEVVALLERREVNVHLPVIPLLQRDLYAHPREAPLLLPANNCDLSSACGSISSRAPEKFASRCLVAPCLPSKYATSPPSTEIDSMSSRGGGLRLPRFSLRGGERPRGDPP
eukprot:CAMPEP_0180182478 /NCGR_PEP_ID=MMETSP0986-20121125/40684_1 /TAXON_ID=697907 /ORGANISM="non described non described, Strain CCMP2293" /LENGTH=311 /DNA_ID=CAMNT_0022135843 /DNA_START=180 /DNA_END=1111 /DNA_ORIENTATION=-